MSITISPTQQFKGFKLLEENKYLIPYTLQNCQAQETLNNYAVTCMHEALFVAGNSFPMLKKCPETQNIVVYHIQSYSIISQAESSVYLSKEHMAHACMVLLAFEIKEQLRCAESAITVESRVVQLQES